MNNCDIIIPIYNADGALKDCIGSVIKSTDLHNNTLVLINEGALDEKMQALIGEYQKNDPDINIRILKKDDNIGFAATLNLGMKLSRNDILILNGNTKVSPNWLEKIKKCANSSESIGTVTPLCNHFISVSCTDALKQNEVRDDITLEEYNDIIEKSSYYEYPEIPAAYDFCMFIKREVIDLIGFFDEKSFSEGYGVINDYSYRAIDYGYRNVICDTTMVYRNDDQMLDKKNMALHDDIRILNIRYPQYASNSEKWCREMPDKHICENIKMNLELYGRKNILILIHEFEDVLGGTSFHIMDIINGLRDKMNFHVLYPSGEQYVIKSFFERTEKRTVLPYKVRRFSALSHYNSMYRVMIKDIISAFAIDTMHIHHMMWHYFDVIDAAKESGVYSIITLHDYYSVCPNVNLLFCGEEYCGNIGNPDCIKCLASTNKTNNNIIEKWHDDWEKFLGKFDRIISPSEDAKNIVLSYYNNLNIEAIEHGIEVKKSDYTPLPQGKFNVAFIGVVCRHKGSHIINSLIGDCRNDNIHFHVFGKTEIEDLAVSRNNYTFHGPYKRENLYQSLHENNIDLVCFVQICPETYSYTLSEVIGAGIPVLSTNIGAGRSRINKNKFGWVIDSFDPAKILDRIIEIYEDKDEYQRAIKAISDYKAKSVAEMDEEYLAIYSMGKKRNADHDALKKLVKFDGKIYEDFQKEKQHLIYEKKEALKKNERLLNYQEKTINDLNFKLRDAIIEYDKIRNSFFWKMTKPLRMVWMPIRARITKNKKIHDLFKILKCFLKKGYKEARKLKIAIDRENKPREPVKQTISDEQRKFESGYNFERKVKFSILVPLYNTPKDFLREMMDSVLAQSYGEWELCLADGSDAEHSYIEEYCKKASDGDSRIIYKKLSENKGISENTNACIDMASGDYIALFDHDDLLHPSALFEYAKAINEKNADFIYCDEDKFENIHSGFYGAYYKPDFAIDNLRGNNYICHFTVFKRSLLDKVGKFRKEFDGSQDHDMILRLTERAENIVHIPKILYRWRVSAASVASDPYAKPYTISAGIKAVSEHLERCGISGIVESSKVHPNTYRIKYDIIGEPLISIIIPNYNHIKDLSRCLDSITALSTYKNYEIIIVENNSDSETFDYYKKIEADPRIRVVIYNTEHCEFNYSAINNFGFKYASGEHIILLNNDIEVISPDWMQEMLMYSQREDVGAVGAMLYYPDDTIQHAGVIIGIGGVAGHSHKYYHRGEPGYFSRLAMAQDCSAVTAACMMMKRKVFEEIGGLDETFKVAFNDVDMCMRIRKAGYLIVFTPYCELYHYESVSRGTEDSAEKQERFKGEVLRFQDRWKKELDAGDPYYNPNLTLDCEDFSEK